MTTCMLGTPLIDIAMNLKRETILILVSRLWYLPNEEEQTIERRIAYRYVPLQMPLQAYVRGIQKYENRLQ